MPRIRPSIFVSLATALVLTGCPSDDSNQGLEGIEADIATSLQQAFAKTPMIMDGLERLIIAASGGPSDGVTISPTPSGFTAVVAMDFDNDGTRETDLNGTAVGAFTGSPTFVSFSAPPSTGESANATVENGGSTLDVYDVGGTFPTPSLGIETIITGGDFDVDLETGNVTGEVEIEVLNDGDPVGATVHFEPDGAGGFHLRVTGRNDAFEFLVPLRAAAARTAAH